MDIALKNLLIRLLETVKNLKSHSIDEILKQISELPELPEELLEKEIKKEAKKHIKNTNMQTLVHILLGQIYLKKEKYDLAIKNYCKALESNENAQLAYNGLLKIYAKKIEYSEEIAKILVSHGNKDFLEILATLATEEIRSEKSSKDDGNYMKKLISDMLDVENEKNLFHRILHKHNIDKNNELYEKCKKTYFCTIKILSNLLIYEYSDLEISHYAKKSVACKLLLKDENGNASKFRMNYKSGMNDPTEGKTLLSFLGIEPESDSKLPDELAFIASFTSNADSLNQFRLYGKEDEKEATGVSIVFKDSFFCKIANNDFSDESLKKKYPLCQCAYIDLKKQVIFTGRETEIIKENLCTSFEKNRTIDLSKKYFEQEDVLHRINDLFNDLKNDICELNKKLKKDKDLLLHLLVNIRYLVKDCAFIEEHECRIFDVKNKKDGSIKTEDHVRSYIETSEIKDYVSEIYFAPLTEGMDIFELETGIDCIPSRHPYKPKRQ